LTSRNPTALAKTLPLSAISPALHAAQCSRLFRTPSGDRATNRATPSMSPPWASAWNSGRVDGVIGSSSFMAQSGSRLKLGVIGGNSQR
jgi:hypothetical protein